MLLCLRLYIFDYFLPVYHSCYKTIKLFHKVIRKSTITPKQYFKIVENKIM